jgi:tetratricopeptide (TPR) repeat protein
MLSLAGISCLVGLFALAGEGLPADGLARGKALLERSDFEGAEAAFEEAIARGAAGEEAFLGAGRAARGAGRHERALEAFLRGLSRTPSSPDLHFEAARSLEDLERDESAARHHEEALALRPDHVPALIALGVLRSRSGKLEDAVRLLESAASSDPRNIAARHNLAVVKARRGDLEGALAEYTAAAAIDPGEAKVRYGRGTVLEKLGRIEEAVRELEEAAALDPEYSPPFWRLSSILFRLGRNVEAERHLARFRDLKSKAHVRKAGDLARGKDWSGAIRELERALDAGGDPAGVHGRLGFVHLEAGNTALAVVHARRAADLEPTAARFANLSWVLSHNGEREEAVRWIDRAIELDPGRKELREQRARILESR